MIGYIAPIKLARGGPTSRISYRSLLPVGRAPTPHLCDYDCPIWPARIQVGLFNIMQ